MSEKRSMVGEMHRSRFPTRLTAEAMTVHMTPDTQRNNSRRHRSTERRVNNFVITLLLIIVLRCNLLCCSTDNCERLEAAGSTKVSRTCSARANAEHCKCVPLNVLVVCL